MTATIVHIGLGAFFRAHQAWYTDQASAAGEWEIVAYTGRSPEIARVLEKQEFKYSLAVRGPESDEVMQIRSISRAESGLNIEDLKATVAAKDVAVITLTITEAGYDILEDGPLEESALGRLALALYARLQNGGKPVAIVPCDNIPNNGTKTHEVLRRLGKNLGQDFLTYLDSKVSWVSTSVDRITPRTTEEDLAQFKNQGIVDPALVITEPFSDWILAGNFPQGRPNWEVKGAKFVDNIEPFENRKLWLLNGSHTLLALLGTLRGHTTVAEAVGDLTCRSEVVGLMNSAANNLPGEELDIANYRSALIRRFENPRIEHKLSQILQDTSIKLGIRIAPVAILEYQANRIPKGAITAFASWVLLCKQGLEIDTNISDIKRALQSSESVRNLIAVASPELANNEDFVESVKMTMASLGYVEPLQNQFSSTDQFEVKKLQQQQS